MDEYWESFYNRRSMKGKKQSKASLDKAKASERRQLRSLPSPAEVPYDPAHLEDPRLFINRELSWLEFNQRVLDQALDTFHPLLERVKFIAIMGSNLDEFFMIRVATLLKKWRADIDDITPDGLSTEEQLQAIRVRALQMFKDQNNCWDKILRPQLATEGLLVVEPEHYTSRMHEYLKDYFHREIFPVLTPLAIDPSHPFPHISNLSLNFAAVVQHEKQIKFARVKISDQLPRFIRLPERVCDKPGVHFVFLEDVIRLHLAELFPNTQIIEAYLFRLTRDTDMVIQDDEADDLLETVDKGLKERRYGDVSLLQIEQGMSQRVLDVLMDNLEIEEDVVFRTTYRMAFSQWNEFLKILKPQLKDAILPAKNIFADETPETLFEKLRYSDYLVHHPYESFTAVEDFLSAAVVDPNVLAIKMTLYRIGTNSPIIPKLIQAAESGKQVSVLVELKARFDEKNNILWAKRLEDVGIHVVYGLVNLKTHCKLCLVVRKEHDGIKRYAHLATGNYNAATAKVYTDLGLFTTNDALTEEVAQVFNYLTGYSEKRDYKNLIVAPINFRNRMMELIEREIHNARAGLPAHITIKVNGLADPRMAQALYRASQAGVKVDLVIRGVCILRPGIPGISDNIKVMSIVGRFLEHSRMYYFANGGNDEIYLGSGDLMGRNLDRRVEVLFPVVDIELKSHLKTVLRDIILKDTGRAHFLQSDGSYRGFQDVPPANRFNSQNELVKLYLSTPTY